MVRPLYLEAPDLAGPASASTGISEAQSLGGPRGPSPQYLAKKKLNSTMKKKKVSYWKILNNNCLNLDPGKAGECTRDHPKFKSFQGPNAGPAQCLKSGAMVPALAPECCFWHQTKIFWHHDLSYIFKEEIM